MAYICFWRKALTLLNQEPDQCHKILQFTVFRKARLGLIPADRSVG